MKLKRYKSIFKEEKLKESGYQIMSKFIEDYGPRTSFYLFVTSFFENEDVKNNKDFTKIVKKLQETFSFIKKFFK